MKEKERDWDTNERLEFGMLGIQDQNNTQKAYLR